MEYYIQIKINALDYAILGVLNRLALDPDQMTPNKSNLTKSKFLSKSNSGQWYPVAYFFRKIIPFKICYETHDGKVLEIAKAFNT